MCGIYGFISPEIESEKKEIINAMSNELFHRGPDQIGNFINEYIALGINRLSILDIENGAQPILSNDKNFVIIHNGEIYNYRSLRAQLESKGYIFKTNSDTEVIVNLYQEKGPECLKDLNGMFSFAIYNIKNNDLFIARDRFGIKPLYYSKNVNKLYFASELKALQKVKYLPTEISYDAIDLFLTMENIPAPFTIYKDVFKLEPGHYLEFKNNKLLKKKWYELSYDNKFKIQNENEYIENIDFLIKNSIQKRMVSEVELGAFLSGGLDSSLIASYLQNECRDLNTFNIAFEDSSFDESDYSKIVSNHLRTNHHIETFSSDAMLNQLPSIWKNMDEPFSDASFLPTYFLSQFTKKSVTVALSGDAGDEVFGGYPTYFAHKIAKWIPDWSISSLQQMSNYIPVNFNNLSFDFKIKQFVKSLNYSQEECHQYWLGSFDAEHKKKLYSNSFLSNLNNENNLFLLLQVGKNTVKKKSDWERFMKQDMRFYLQDDMLVKVDRCSMAHSLEVRIPFLDHDLVEYMARVPSYFKYRGVTSKYLLKKIGLKYLPQKIVNRSKKGFGIPIAKWICGPLKKQFQNVILDPNSNINKLFNQKYNIKILNDHFNHRSDNRKLLWTLFCLENWLRINKGN